VTNAYHRIKQTIYSLIVVLFLAACSGSSDPGGLPPADPAPTILSINPKNQTIDVDVNQPIEVQFSEELTISIDNISLKKYSTTQPNNFNDTAAQLIDRKLLLLAANGIEFDSASNTLSIRPVIKETEYASETRYRIELTGIKDSANNLLPTRQWEFTTTTVPFLTMLPISKKTVSRAQNITIEFSEPMDLDTLRNPNAITMARNFTLTEFALNDDPTTATGTPVAAANIKFSYNDSTNTATYTIPSLLNELRQYVATLSSVVTDVNGITIAQKKSTTFFTNTTNSTEELQINTFVVSASPHVNTVEVRWEVAKLIAVDST